MSCHCLEDHIRPFLQIRCRSERPRAYLAPRPPRSKPGRRNCLPRQQPTEKQQCKVTKRPSAASVRRTRWQQRRKYPSAPQAPQASARETAETEAAAAGSTPAAKWAIEETEPPPESMPGESTTGGPPAVCPFSRRQAIRSTRPPAY